MAVRTVLHENIEAKRWRLACWGMFLLLLGVYLFTHPCRIDAVDGQLRFEVSHNMLGMNGPIVNDYYLLAFNQPANPRTRQAYSFYGIIPSLTPLPAMFVNRALRPFSFAEQRFSFTLAGVYLGALIAPLLLAFYRKLGVNLSRALSCAAVFCLATLWWPGSNTVFDQNQHGLILLASLMAAWEAGRRRSLAFALLAGVLASLLVCYRNTYITILPTIAFALFATRDEGCQDTPKTSLKEGLPRFLIYGFGCMFGIGLYLFYNWVRFGQQAGISSGPASTSPVFGSPLVGFLTVSLSPGKGILWFSPPLVLAIWGYKKLRSRAPRLTQAILWTTLFHVGLISCLIFASGDSCWGPRYLLPVMPLWALSLPFALDSAFIRRLWKPFVVVGVVVQLLGISLDHGRFFFQNRFTEALWQNPFTYFRMSQLASRPSEIWESIAERDLRRTKLIPSQNGEPTYYTTGPSAEMVSKIQPLKMKAGMDPQEYFRQKSILMRNAKYATPDTRTWQKQFKMLYLPRPWWGWINQVPADQRPVEASTMWIACLLLTGSGAGLLLAAKKLKGTDPLTDTHLQDAHA